jgi:hypothetical protein
METGVAESSPFDIGPWEVAVVLLVTLIIFGPGRLVPAVRSLIVGLSAAFRRPASATTAETLVGVGRASWPLLRLVLFAAIFVVAIAVLLRLPATMQALVIGAVVTLALIRECRSAAGWQGMIRSREVPMLLIAGWLTLTRLSTATDAPGWARLVIADLPISAVFIPLVLLLIWMIWAHRTSQPAQRPSHE